jgi:hypothetical protein
MKPKLIVVKKKKLKDGRIVTETHFAIVDLDNPQGYPSNFVCILPFREQAFKNESAYKVEFNKIFGKESLVRALKFLNDALLEENDPIILNAIKKHLRMLTVQLKGNI